MMHDNNLPSAFRPDQMSRASVEAPSSVSRIAAQVLGALIAAQVLKLDEFPGETIEMVDRVIATALNSALDDIDLQEIKRTSTARAEARRASKDGASPTHPIPFHAPTLPKNDA